MKIRVFDETFEIEGFTDPLFFDGYICNDNHGKRIDISEDDIIFERSATVNYLLSHKQDADGFSDILIYRLAILRKIAEYAPNYSAFLFHGSAISFDKNGIIFCARSGIGKSTHSSLWNECFGDQVAYINDDKPFIKQNKENVH